MGALREELAQEPLLAEWAATTNAGPSTAVAAATSAQDDSFMIPTLDGDITLRRSSMRNEARAVETEIKFAGYLEQQTKSIAKLKAAEALAIPEWLDYSAISGLSREMREKLERVRPATIGQASRMPGVTPAALSLVHVSIRVQGARRLVS
jgi:tRNA uridine 5-carboxymethylaminomethyl modification enzyme